jgi:DNA-binding NarL/FixJ family response regulator
MAEKGIVLLLEDNEKILDINRRMLEKDGLVALTAQTIAQARERIKIAVPDVAVLDIMLPDGSGLDFLEELREVCDAPVLFLTAKAKRADVLAGLTAGGNDYITKPYDIDEFRMRVKNFLRLSRGKPRPITCKRSAEAEGSVSIKLHRHPPSATSLLTEKELIVAVLAARGMLNKEIADEVNLSESRIKTCLSGIYRKLGIAEKENKRETLARILED